MKQFKLRRSTWLVGPVAALALAMSVAASGAMAQEDAAAGSPDDALAAEKLFLDENAAAMDRMMSRMDVKPTGDVDRDFVATMAPHHQGAIDMAQAYLRHGRNEQLRRLAQEIIVEQAQEIAAMNLAVGDPLPISAPAPTEIMPQKAAAAAVAPAPHHHHTTDR